MVGAAAKPTPAPPQPAQKTRPNSAGREGRGAGQPAVWVRVLVSLAIVWHLSAVTLAPLSIAPSSPLVVNLAQYHMQWYLDLLYLNHGYHFFAPDPGAGHLIRYELFDERGGLLQQGEFPNPKQQWPRLYYHRYFMLADQVGIPSDDEQFRKYWQRRYLEAYARQLLREYDGQSIRLRWIAHYPLPPLLAEQGRKMTDPESYEVLMEVTQRRSDLEPAPEMQSGVWQGGSAETATRWSGVPR